MAIKNGDILIFKTLSLVQGLYTLVTAVWPLVDINSFMLVTGPKTDIWLVKTVGAILVPFGLCFVFARNIQRDHWMIILAGMFLSAGLVFIDFYYTANNTIRWVYAVDGVAQAIFFVAWIYVFFNRNKLKRTW